MLEHEIGETVINGAVFDSPKIDAAAEEKARRDRAAILPLTDHLRRHIYPPDFGEELGMAWKEPSRPAPDLEDALARWLEPEPCKCWQEQARRFFVPGVVERIGLPSRSPR